MPPTDVRTLTDEELNQAFWEVLGITRCCDKRDFVGDFNALLATKERDGIDGPWAVASPKQRRTIVLFFTRRSPAYVYFTTGLDWLNERGPRPLAEACLVALNPEKYTMEETDAD